MCVKTFVHVQKPEIEIKVSSSILLHHILWDKISHWTWSSVIAWLVCLISKLQGSAHLFTLALGSRQESLQLTFIKTLGRELRSLCLCDRYFNDWFSISFSSGNDHLFWRLSFSLALCKLRTWVNWSQNLWNSLKFLGQREARSLVGLFGLSYSLLQP